MSVWLPGMSRGVSASTGDGANLRFSPKVCQFCFNNIKNNMNGLCPACRRPYDEKTIEWKVVTSEEYVPDYQHAAP